MELATTPVSSICTPSIIFLDQTYSINEALKILYSNQLLVAPVLNSESRLCTGMIDAMDMLGYVLSVPMDAPTWASEVSLRFTTPIYRAIDFCGRDPVVTVNESTRLSEVISAYFRRGVKRVLVQNATSNIVGILTQSDAVNFIKKIMGNNPRSDLGKLGSRHLRDLDFTKKVICIQETSNLLSAFQMIVANRVTSVAVIDDNGALKGNVSSTDFQNINSGNFQGLATNLKAYLTVNPVMATRETSFLGALQLIQDGKVHRIYVVDDNDVPIGLLSMTDILRVVSDQFKFEQTSSMGL